MARRAFAADEGITRLDEGWHLTLSAPDALSGPDELDAQGQPPIPAKVPGTVAGALREAGQFSAEAPEPLHDKDAWYWREVVVEEPGPRTLVLEGLATIAEVYWNGELILTSDSMFRAHEIEIEARPRNELALCFRALAPRLETKGPRARWRPQLAASQGLRLFRTTLLGHMPGWCPDVHAVGPWRPISLIRSDRPHVTVTQLASRLDADGTGHLTLTFTTGGCDGEPTIRCAGATAPATRRDDGTWQGELAIRDVAPWWPHSHGTPTLFPVEAEINGMVFDCGRTGFRRIEVSQGIDGKGFGLKVNGVDVFCRGAVWTSVDIVDLPGTRERYRGWLDLAREAGMNMLRIPGMTIYEAPAFFDLCDELGLMVWQDFQFANYDYPVKDEAFAAGVETEARQFLERTEASPALAVLCGGSEIYQQGAMLGLPESRWKGPLTETLLAGIASELRPDIPYVPNSPCGGAQPFFPGEGIAHYYGVGAYKRPLEDARRAEVRFAAECLAFSNVPQQCTLDAHLPAMPGHDPRWKARVPRDRGVGWDFEDVRDHYLKDLYGVEAAELRYADPARYLDLSRAVSGEVMEATFAEWRRAASPCAGALVWTFQDLLPGAGWGIIDATGEPKPAWYALKRAFRPLQVQLSDEGTNGLCAHAINETADARTLHLSLTCLRDGKTPVVSGKRELSLGPRQSLEIPATALFGAFFDTTYAYRFGPPSHDVTLARLSDPAGEIVAEAFHFPLGRQRGRVPLSLDVSLEGDEASGWRLRLAADRFAQSVHIEDETFRPDDDWFHLTPGAEKVIDLRARTDESGKTRPCGRITALNGTGSAGY